METPFTPDYMRGFDQGQKHANPSPETLRIIDSMQSELAEIKKEVAKIATTQAVMTAQFATLIASLEKRENAFDKYSDETEKKIEKISDKINGVDVSQKVMVAKASVIATVLAFVASIAKDLILK